MGLKSIWIYFETKTLSFLIELEPIYIIFISLKKKCMYVHNALVMAICCTNIDMLKNK